MIKKKKTRTRLLVIKKRRGWKERRRRTIRENGKIAISKEKTPLGKGARKGDIGT